MPEIRRIIRKLQPIGPQSFDEQLWPIYVSIVVLGAYLLGVVLSFLHFDDPRFYANAATWLGIVTVAIGGALWCVGVIQNRLLRRTLFLSLILSLIINVSLLVGMAWTSIFPPFWEQDKPEAIAKRPQPEVVVPEYPIWNEQQEQRVPQEHEKPVETGDPQAEERLELTRQATESEIQPNEPMPSPADMGQPNASTKPQRVDAPAAPRRNELLAKLSRQPLRSELRISNSPKLPTQPRVAESSSSELQAQATEVSATRQQMADRPALPETDDQSPMQRQPIELARRSETVSPEANSSALPTLPRKINRPTTLPQTSTPLESTSTVARKTSNDAVEAGSTLMPKRATSAPEPQTNSADLVPDVAVNVARANRTEVELPPTEQLSHSLERANLSVQATSDINTDAPAATPTESPTESPSPTSSPTQIVRNNTSPEPTDASRVLSPTETTEAQPTPMALARATSDSPSLSSSEAAQRTVARASRSADAPASPKVDVGRAVASEADSAQPSEESNPSRLALARSSVGVAGVGAAANLERGIAAPESPISISSASASRLRATQDMDPGPALAPSTRSLTRSLRAGEQAPKTSQQSQPIETAMVPGATVPAAEASSASASLEKTASNVPTGAITAARGRAEVDLGPTRISTDKGDGRAEGGGQPQLTMGEQPRALERSDAIAGQASLKTDKQASASESPLGRDASATSDANATATAVSRTDSTEAGGGSAADAEVGPPTKINIQAAAMSRADSISDAEAISMASGGGNRLAGRQARALAIRTSTTSDVPAIASVDDSSGTNNGQPLDAQGVRPQRAAAGLLTANPSDDAGALVGNETVDGEFDSRIALAVNQRADSGSDAGESIAISSNDRGAPDRRRLTTAAGASTDVELDPEEFAQNTPGHAKGDSINKLDALIAAEEGMEAGGGALMVEADLPDVEGGIGDQSAIDAGIVSRKAQDDSELVSFQPARFIRKTTGGATAAASTNVVANTQAFQRRLNRKGDEPAGERGLPSPKTEAAIELGLVFLSRYQNTDGSWSLNFGTGKVETPADEEATIVSDTAATGLSLLSFLGAGYHHKDDKYQEVVKGALDFLRKNQKKNGDLYLDQDANSSRSAWLYSHATAAIALCEAYGMTQDPDLKEPAQKSLDFILSSQHKTRGGWRYAPEYGSDTSVTGWMMMALKSGDLAGLDVDDDAYDRIEDWMELARVSDVQPYLFRYNPYAPDTDQQRHGRSPTRAMTAVGLLMRLYTGWRRDNPQMILGARTLKQNPPEMGTSSKPRRDTYYWYYATQVMYHMGGEYWEEWNSQLHPLLTETQIKQGKLSGSWNPITPVPDRWAAHGGRLYVTTLNLLSLEVFYRHLPIYEETAK